MIGVKMRVKQVRQTQINSPKTWEMWGIPLFGGNKSRLLSKISDIVERKSDKCWIATVNPEFMMLAVKEANFAKILQNQTTINVVDGVGLLWAKNVMKVAGWRRWLAAGKVGVEILRGEHGSEVISGADLMDDLCRMAADKDWGVYFFGGWGERAGKTAEYFMNKYPGLRVVGWRAEGYEVETKADILLVARGMRKQEEWISQHWQNLRVKVVMGVGRSFDYYSGELKRAPEWWRRAGLEWLYSLYQEPSRWRRQLVLPRFVWQVLLGGERWTGVEMRRGSGRKSGGRYR